MTDYGLPSAVIVDTNSTIQNTPPSNEKLHGIMVLKDFSNWNSNKIYEKVASASEFVALFGNQYADLVNKYFGQVNKKGSSPQYLIVVNWFSKEVSAFIQGAKLSADFDNTNKIAGAVLVNIDGVSNSLNIDLTNSTSYNDIASILQNDIRALGGIDTPATATGKVASTNTMSDILTLNALSFTIDIEYPTGTITSYNVPNMDLTTQTFTTHNEVATFIQNELTANNIPLTISYISANGKFEFKTDDMGDIKINTLTTTGDTNDYLGLNDVDKVDGNAHDTKFDLIITFDSIYKRFNVEGVTKGQTASLNLIDAIGSEIFKKIKLEGNGVINSDGVDAETILNVFDKTRISNNFGYTFFFADNLTFTNNDYLSIGNWFNGNVEFKLVLSIIGEDDSCAISKIFIDNNINGVKVLYSKDGTDRKDVLDASIGACQNPQDNQFTDYNNFFALGFKTDTDRGTQQDIATGQTNLSLYNHLIANKVGFIANIGDGGGVNSDLVFVDGSMAGTFQDETVHYINNYICKQERKAVKDFIVNSAIVGANDPDTIDKLNNVLTTRFLNFKDAKLITNKELTNDEKQVILNNGGTQKTLSSLQNIGFAIQKITISKNSDNKWQANILIFWIINTSLKKVIINNYIIN